MLDKWKPFSTKTVTPRRSKLEHALADHRLLISSQGRIGLRHKLFEEIGREDLYMALYYNKEEHQLGLRFFQTKVKDSFKLSPQNTRGSQTHPTPVSYTHLTLPTICSV